MGAYTITRPIVDVAIEFGGHGFIICRESMLCVPRFLLRITLLRFTRNENPISVAFSINFCASTNDTVIRFYAFVSIGVQREWE